MEKLFSQHTVKVQIGIAASVLMSIFYFGAQVSAFVSTAEINFKRLDVVEQKANLVPVLESNIKNVQTDLTEIKGDIKYLIKLNK